MKKQTIGILVFCIILAVVLFYVYYTYDRVDDSLFTVSISSQYNKERVKTGYVIDGINGNTSYTYESHTFPKKVISIKNINLDDQDFYEEERFYNITENTRIDLILERPEKVFFDIKENDTIFVNLTSKNFKDINFCLLGSLNYLLIKTKPRKNVLFFNLTKDNNVKQVISEKYNVENFPGYVISNSFYRDVPYQEINKLGNFTDYDRCYAGNFSLKDSSRILEIEYTEFGRIRKNDYINLSLIDKAGNVATMKIK